MVSVDGIIWTGQSFASPQVLSAVTYANDQFVAVGEYGTILTSPAVDIAIEKAPSRNYQHPTLSAHYLTSNALRITVPQSLRSSSATVSIYNIAGKRCYTGTVSASAGEAHVAAVNLPAGVYCLGVKSSGQKRFAKFVVVR
ncbi:MAG: T9SS type A sorting domain-containing protein [Fibrobacterota bacterium]